MLRKIGKWLWDGWMKFAHIVGEVNQFILLGIVYFVFIGIYAVCAWPIKLFTRSSKSSWQVSRSPETREQLTRPF